MIVLWVFVFALLGALIGGVTGLLPGIHVNVTASLLAAASVTLAAAGVPFPALGAFIVALTVTHAFFDILPSVFLGIPGDESYALLPSQRLVMQGQGLEAVHHAVHGSWGGLLAACGVVIVALSLGDGMKALEEALGPWLGVILAGAAGVLIATDRRRGWALVVFLSSGLLGLIIFATPRVARDGAFNVLFPALGGLFGLSGLIIALMSRDAALPAQEDGVRPAADRVSVLVGTLGGVLSGLLPGLGSANVATLLVLRGGVARYLQTVAAINTSDHLVSIAALVLVARPRSGASIALSAAGEAYGDGGAALGAGGLVLLCGVALAVGFASRAILLRAAPVMVAQVCALPHRALTLAVIVFVTVLAGVTTGPWGLLILVTSTALGMVAPLSGARRAHAMGLFLVPVALAYLGLQADVVTALGLGQITVPRPPERPVLVLAALLAAMGAAAGVFLALGGRRWRAIAVGLGLLLAAVGVASLPPAEGQARGFVTTVVRVKDGDTVRVRTAGRDIDVRLVDIDAPEKKQPYGAQARRRVQELVDGVEVTVRIVGRDKYGRSLGYIDLPDGRVLNRLLVQEGWAWRFDRYCNDAELLRLQQAARSARRGLWADTAPIPPWEFRHARR